MIFKFCQVLHVSLVILLCVNPAVQPLHDRISKPKKSTRENFSNNVRRQKQVRIRHNTKSLTPSLILKVAKEANIYLNHKNVRRVYDFTHPNDKSFLSILNEYRSIVGMLGTTIPQFQNVRPLQQFENIQRLRYQGANKNKQKRVDENFDELDKHQIPRNPEYFYKKWKTFLPPSVDHTTELNLMPKPSRPALIRGVQPEWLSLGRQRQEYVYTYAEPDYGAEEGANNTRDPNAQIGGAAGDGAANRYTIPGSTTKRKRRRTSPYRISMLEDCDYNAYYCLKAFDTGQVCGKSLYYTHFTFRSYCLLEFVNCMERHEAWIPVYMGECMPITPLSYYIPYEYSYKYHLDNYVVADDL